MFPHARVPFGGCPIFDPHPWTPGHGHAHIARVRRAPRARHARPCASGAAGHGGAPAPQRRRRTARLAGLRARVAWAGSPPNLEEGKLKACGFRPNLCLLSFLFFDKEHGHSLDLRTWGQTSPFGLILSEFHG